MDIVEIKLTIEGECDHNELVKTLRGLADSIENNGMIFNDEYADEDLVINLVVT